MKPVIKATLAAIGGTVLLTMSTMALSSSDHDKARSLKEGGEIVPLETILNKAKTDQPGRVVETELERKGERYVYEIKIVDDKGTVRELKYDAKTGELLKRERESKRD